VVTISQDGLTPEQQLDAINLAAHKLMLEQQRIWVHLREKLSDEGIRVLERTELSTRDKKWLDSYFMDHIFPVMTPMAIDPAHPFPFIPNLGFTLVMLLKRRKSEEILRALLPIPHLLERFVRLPGSTVRFIPMEEFLVLFLDRLFPDYDPVQKIGRAHV